MTKEYTEALTEVSEILKHMKINDVSKIPKNILTFIEQNKSYDYDFILTEEDTFSSKDVKRETLAFLGLISLNYWCKSEDEKSNLYKEFQINEERYENELKEQYDLDIIFKNKKQEVNTEMIKYQAPNMIQRVLKKVKNFFVNSIK